MNYPVTIMSQNLGELQLRLNTFQQDCFKDGTALVTVVLGSMNNSFGVLYLPCRVIIFQKLLILPCHTCVRAF